MTTNPRAHSYSVVTTAPAGPTKFSFYLLAFDSHICTMVQAYAGYRIHSLCTNPLKKSHEELHIQSPKAVKSVYRNRVLQVHSRGKWPHLMMSLPYRKPDARWWIENSRDKGLLTLEIGSLPSTGDQSASLKWLVADVS